MMESEVVTEVVGKTRMRKRLLEGKLLNAIVSEVVDE